MILGGMIRQLNTMGSVIMHQQVVESGMVAIGSVENGVMLPMMNHVWLKQKNGTEIPIG